jgi:DNA polymerase III subunit gamma/tau
MVYRLFYLCHLQMEKFIVSARKYRPVTFDTVVGQPGITKTLKNAIKSHHMAQAFLFCGPRGVGKTTTARILAKTINCTNLSPNTEACNECESCISFNNGQSLNIFELDAASNNSVEDIRNLVDQVRYVPQSGKYKVYIIDEVHMLSGAAFNAFLKTLEEPPSYVVFILATTEKHKIIPTILSRCQIFDFNRISVEDATQHLQSIAEKENVAAEEDALHVIAQKADGALRDALSMFDQLVSFAGNKLTYKTVIDNLNILDYDYYFSITDEILEGNLSAAFLTFNEILNRGFDGHNFINGLSSHFRDLLVCKDEVTLKLLEVSQNVREKYKLQSRQCPAPLLLQLLDISSKCDIDYRAAKHQRLHVEIALMKMCSLNSEGLKKKVEIVTTVPQPKAEQQKPEQPKPFTPPLSTPSVAREPNPKSETRNQQSRRPGISITENIKPQEKKTELRQAQLPVAEALEATATKQFSQRELEIVWDEFAAQQQKAGRYSLHAALVKRKPLLKENLTIEFLLDNAALEKDITEIKMELMMHLRQNLGNGSIQLTTAIDKTAVSKNKIYDPKEKYRRLVEKNPALQQLKNKFDLDIDY